MTDRMSDVAHTDESRELAHRTDGRLRDLHLGPAHALLGAQAEGDLLLQGHVDRVALHRRRVLAARGRDRCKIHSRARARGAGAGERDSAKRCIAGALLRKAGVAGEAPGAVDEDANADPLRLGVGDGVDLTVLRRHQLRTAPDDAGVRVAGAGADGGVDCES